MSAPTDPRTYLQRLREQNFSQALAKLSPEVETETSTNPSGYKTLATLATLAARPSRQPDPSAHARIKKEIISTTSSSATGGDTHPGRITGRECDSTPGETGESGESYGNINYCSHLGARKLAKVLAKVGESGANPLAGPPSWPEIPDQPDPYRCVVCGERGDGGFNCLVPVLHPRSTPKAPEHRWLHLDCHEAYLAEIARRRAALRAEAA